MPQHKYIFRYIGWTNIGPLIVLAAMHRIVSIHYLAGRTVCLKILRAVLKADQLHKILPIGHIQNIHYGQALDLVDDVYNSIIRPAGRSLKPGRSVLEPVLLERIFKKELATEIASVCYLLQLAGSLEGEDCGSVLIDTHYGRFKSSPIKKMVFVGITVNPGIWKLTDWFAAISSILIQRLALLIMPVILMAFAIRNIFNRIQKETYRHAVLIHNAKHQFKADGKYYDFLIDDVSIHGDEVLFIQMNDIPTHLLDLQKARGRHFTPLLSYLYVLSRSRSRDLLGLAISILPLLKLNLMLPMGDFVSKGIQTSVMNIIRWTLILKMYKFENLITFNDEQTSHIARNAVLKNAGIETWYYAHSAAMGYCSNSLSKPAGKRHLLWSYLSYDHYVTWNTAMRDYILSHPVFFGQVHVIGCLWSQFIYQVSDSLSVNRIVAFDTSYIGNIDEGILFYQDILDYADKTPHVQVIFKPKKDFLDYIPGKNFFGSEKYKLLVEMGEKIAKYPNVMVEQYSSDAYSAMSTAKIIVTHAISSSSIEAISAAKRALFYDPKNKYSDTFYDQIEGFVCHSREELWKRLDALLAMGEDQWREQLEKRFKGKVDDFLDGGAIDRFRSIIVKKINIKFD